ncbi:MAG: hypothetical protein JSU86_08420, partial [Phycisphaerales bacterium]
VDDAHPSRKGNDVMKRAGILGAVTLIATVPLAAWADIPRPDAVFYGVVRIDGAPVSATDDLTLVARLEGRDTPIAVYRMGAQPTAGDRYVLWIPQAVQEDGKNPSPDSPRAGQVAKIFVRQGSAPELFVTDAVVPASGEVQQLDLSVSGAELAAQAVPDADPAGACGQGGGLCGAMGMISLGLTFCGLAQMKHRQIRRRRNQGRV